MIYFLFGEDSYRSKRKLEEIVLSYKEKNKSGLNLIYIDAKEKNFKDFYSSLSINSMFAEKKLVVFKNVFENKDFQESILENIKKLEELKDILIIYEDNPPDQRTKLFKALQKNAKCQEFSFLQPAMLRKWIGQEFKNNKVEIGSDALDLLANSVGGDLWQMANEINKLSNYRAGSVVTKEDVKQMVKPNIENEIFVTIEAIASKNKKMALSLMHKHFNDGDNALYLLSMIAYQFKNILIIKEFQDNNEPYGQIAKKSGLHPFVVQKTYNLCGQFSLSQLKKIYRKIFQIDSDIKTGKIEAELALDLLLSEI